VRLEKFSGGVIDQMSPIRGGDSASSTYSAIYYKVVINSPGYNAAAQDADLQDALQGVFWSSN